jgi:plastocyanin
MGDKHKSVQGFVSCIPSLSRERGLMAMARNSVFGSAAMRLSTLIGRLALSAVAGMIGLACLWPLISVAQSMVEPDEIGRKRLAHQRSVPVAAQSAKFSQAQGGGIPIDESKTESPAQVVRSGGEVFLEKSSHSGSLGPVIVGRVLYRGPVAAQPKLEVNRDQDVCGMTMLTSTLSVDAATHGVQNAVVHVEPSPHEAPIGGLPPNPVVIRNTQCRFLPHVAAAQVGSEAIISNEDPVMHNVNITVDARTVLNVALVAGGRQIKKPLKMSGLHLLKCNVHKFMQSYRLLFDDPYFDLTAEDGQFTISGVSPGLRTITVWHETLGVMQKDVQVPVRGTVVVDLEYK